MNVFPAFKNVHQIHVDQPLENNSRWNVYSNSIFYYEMLLACISLNRISGYTDTSWGSESALDLTILQAVSCGLNIFVSSWIQVQVYDIVRKQNALQVSLMSLNHYAEIYPPLLHLNRFKNKIHTCSVFNFLQKNFC